MNSARAGMLLFLFSEAIFFAFLLIAYITFHQGPARNSMKTELDVARTGLFTVILLSSSLSAWRAHSAGLSGKLSKFQGWISLTILLGGIFLWGQASEYYRLFDREVTISRDSLSTSFFTVTGFHGLHVCAGLVLLVLLLFWSVFQRRRGRALPPGAVDAISLYWHFVDVVWVVVFALVYLWGTR